MLLLVTQAEPDMVAYAHPNLGRLVQPRHYPRIADTATRGVRWAADCDAYVGWDDAKAERFERMLWALRGLPGCLFVVAPDVVGEQGLTDYLFAEWAPVIMNHGLPVAYVVQETGIEAEPLGIPWGAMDALFIGCATDEEKHSPRVAEVIREARRREKWVHCGRVNTERRVHYMGSQGVDSVDGSGFARWRAARLERGLQWASRLPQTRLFA
jgi:hypothetical protein